MTAVDGSGSTTYTFDADGNQRSVETPAGDLTTSTWNVSSQNTAVELPDGSLVSFVWNSDDVRIVRDDGLDQVRYVWDRHNILLETDEFGQTLSRSTYEQAGFGRLISRDTGGTRAASEKPVPHRMGLARRSLPGRRAIGATRIWKTTRVVPPGCATRK